MIKKILLIILLLVTLVSFNANAITLFDKLFGVSYSKKDMKNDMKNVQTELGVIKENQITLNNNMTAILKINSQIVSNIELNNKISLELKAKLKALAAMSTDIKGQICSVDSSLSQKINAQGNVEANTNKSELFIAQAIQNGAVIVIFIIAFVIVIIVLSKKDKEIKHREEIIREKETKAKDFKGRYHDMKKLNEKLIDEKAIKEIKKTIQENKN